MPRNSLLMSQRYTLRTLLVLIALATASACILPSDPGPGGDVGVTARGSAILVRVQPCGADERVRSVALEVASGQPGVQGDVVWEIWSERGSARREYQVGTTPEGFVETMKLGVIRANVRYVAVVDLSSGGLELVTAFTPNTLQPDIWKASGNRTLTDDEFRRLDPCR
jgi:hypothetical protein